MYTLLRWCGSRLSLTALVLALGISGLILAHRRMGTAAAAGVVAVTVVAVSVAAATWAASAAWATWVATAVWAARGHGWLRWLRRFWRRWFRLRWAGVRSTVAFYPGFYGLGLGYGLGYGYGLGGYGFGYGYLWYGYGYGYGVWLWWIWLWLRLRRLWRLWRLWLRVMVSGLRGYGYADQRVSVLGLWRLAMPASGGFGYNSAYVTPTTATSMQASAVTWVSMKNQWSAPMARRR